MPRPSYHPKDIRKVMEILGIAEGSTVIVHSSLMHLGQVEGTEIARYPEVITRTLLDYLGPQGTLAVPASDWDYGRKKLPFDIRRSPVTKELGALSAYVAALPEAKRSPNPIFSVAAIGNHAAAICAPTNGNDFGCGSAWDCLFQLDAEILLLGSDLSSLTFTRYIEHRFGVPYLYCKLFDTPVLDNGKRLDLSITATVRYMDYPADYDLARFERKLRAQDILRETDLGGGKVTALRMEPCFSAGIDALQEDVHYFLKKPPAYVKGHVPFD